jgi:hypothetical protein
MSEETWLCDEKSFVKKIKKIMKSQRLQSRANRTKTKNTRTRNFRSSNQKSEKQQAENISNANIVDYSRPKFVDSVGGIVIKKREYVQNIVPQDPFTPVKIEFNPGVSSMFPWLSGVAQNFEKYKVRKLHFIYETSQSTFVPGMIMFAPEFNVSDSLPSTKAELLEYAYATRAPVWKNFRLTLDSSAVMNFKDYYIRVNELSVENDKKLYDPLYLIVATDAVSTDISYAGELWIEYEIELLYPQRIATEVLRFNSYKFLSFSSPTNSAPLANPVLNQGGLLISVTDSARMTFNESFSGYLMILIDVSNLGLSTSFQTNPPVYELSSLGSGTISNMWSVGGTATTPSNPDFIELIYKVYNAIKDDILVIHNLGFDISGGTTGTSVQFIFQQGYV